MINDDNGIRRCEYVRIHDGDTFVADIITWDVPSDRDVARRHIRVKGWNAAELREPEGPLMRDAFEKLLIGASVITLKPSGRSFERVVCSVFLDDQLFAGLLHAKLQALRAT